jgi:hypothetical protein
VKLKKVFRKKDKSHILLQTLLGAATYTIKRQCFRNVLQLNQDKSVFLSFQIAETIISFSSQAKNTEARGQPPGLNT